MWFGWFRFKCSAARWWFYCRVFELFKIPGCVLLILYQLLQLGDLLLLVLLHKHSNVCLFLRLNINVTYGHKWLHYDDGNATLD